MRLDGRSPHCAIGFITVVQGNPSGDHVVVGSKVEVPVVCGQLL
jgi:hypothetical protein